MFSFESTKVVAFRGVQGGVGDRGLVDLSDYFLMIAGFSFLVIG